MILNVMQRLCSGALLLALSGAVFGGAPPSFTVTPLGGIGYVNSFEPIGLNDKGQIIGVKAAGGTWLWQPDSWNGTSGSVVQIGSVEFGASRHGLSNAGLIAGAVGSTAAIWAPSQPNGTAGSTGLMPFSDDVSRVVGLNSSGTTVVWLSDGWGTYRSLLAYAPSIGAFDLGMSVLAPVAGFMDLNERNQVLGQIGTAVSSVRWDLPTAALGSLTATAVPGVGLALNNRGDVSGYTIRDGNGYPAVMYWRGDHYETVEIGGGVRGKASDINDAGWVTGFWEAPNHTRAFLWTPDAGFMDLGDLIPGRFTDDVEINQRGQIVAYDGMVQQGYLPHPSSRCQSQPRRFS